VIHLAKIIFDWATTPAVLGLLLSLSFVSFVASVVGVPWYLRRLPADYFSRSELSESGALQEPRTLSRAALTFAKNTVGAVLLLAGVAMLVLPGQGVATILVGLLMLDFPQKKRFQRRILAIAPVLRTVNSLRRRMGQPPLIVLTDTHEAIEPHSEPYSAR